MLSSSSFGPVLLRARELSRPPLFYKVSFDVHAGEILGLAGLIGAGRSELARAIYGLYSPDSGEMQIGQMSYSPANASDAQRHRIAYLPEERKRQGFVLNHSLQSSMSIGLLKILGRFGWIRDGREEKRISNAVRKFQIKVRNQRQPIATLSGGNQQKALLGRWLETDPQFIILDEPTRGVDIGAKAEIHRLISDLASQGKAILLNSSDLPELLALSDRIVVLHRGKTTGEFVGNKVSQEEILLAASGLRS